MIKVEVIRNQNFQITCLEIKGHSNFAPHGEDLVCAGVSAIVVGGLNALHEYEPLLQELIMKDGYVKIATTSDVNTLQIILKVLETQLITISESYQKYIQIKKITK